MKFFLAIFLSLFYTITSLGAVLQMHTCSGNMTWTISKENLIHEKCPLCSKHSKSHKKKCKTGKCKDIELKLDPLSDKLFSHNHDIQQIVSPAIVLIPWIQEFINMNFDEKSFIIVDHHSDISDTSPPINILHCTFRI